MLDRIAEAIHSPEPPRHWTDGPVRGYWGYASKGWVLWMPGVGDGGIVTFIFSVTMSMT